MRSAVEIMFIFLVLLAVSCSKSVKDEKDSYVIRYVNLSKVYDYAARNDTEAALLRKNQDYPGGIAHEPDEMAETGLIDRDNNEKDSTALNRDDKEKKAKSRIYGRIKKSISNVARRHNADFILNTGEAVIYSKPAYDITDDVIREYKKIHEISSPSLK